MPNSEGSPPPLAVGRRRRCWSLSTPPFCETGSSSCGRGHKPPLSPPRVGRNKHFSCSRKTNCLRFSRRASGKGTRVSPQGEWDVFRPFLPGERYHPPFSFRLAEKKTGRGRSSSAQAPHRLFPPDGENALVPLRLLSPPDPLRWAPAGASAGACLPGRGSLSRLTQS